VSLKIYQILPNLWRVPLFLRSAQFITCNCDTYTCIGTWHLQINNGLTLLASTQGHNLTATETGITSSSTGGNCDAESSPLNFITGEKADISSDGVITGRHNVIFDRQGCQESNVKRFL
jgi:hypothetical protein